MAATGAVLALPPIEEVHAPAAWQCIDFISDLHLAEDTPRTFAAWVGYLEHTSADAVFILGDLFESWVGDDARTAGFEAVCAGVLHRLSVKRSVAFMAGNRDFLVGKAMLDDCGVKPLSDPTLLLAFGNRVLLTHGDALCIADTDYQRFRESVRSPAWQRDFLARPLAERRNIARQIRAESERRKSGSFGGAESVQVDVDAANASRWMAHASAPTLIHGHTHRPGTEQWARGFTRHVLSDWDFDQGSRAEVLRWERTGIHRLSLDDACSPH